MLNIQPNYSLSQNSLAFKAKSPIIPSVKKFNISSKKQLMETMSKLQKLTLMKQQNLSVNKRITMMLSISSLPPIIFIKKLLNAPGFKPGMSQEEICKSIIDAAQKKDPNFLLKTEQQQVIDKLAEAANKDPNHNPDMQIQIIQKLLNATQKKS